MLRIQQLPSSVVTKIAAGEVIERPASVAKELLENSVDAGSTRIDVEVEQGGVELIRVVDNGCGIPTDDFMLAFASHATSKLANADDLFRIGTLGFRGEALASISGVAQVTLQSRPAEAPCGAELTCHGGEFGQVRAWNGAPGTRIEVRHLFFNTPVRRKFLRTTGTEMGHLSEVFTRLALSNSHIHWSLRHNTKSVYGIPAGTPVPERIRMFFGPEVSNRLYELRAEQGPVTLRGWIADPECERGTAKMQYLFLNGRWIRDRSLGHAIQEAYRGLLMTGRYALAFLFLEMPPDQVDVNVHPTKAEVRFRDGNALHHLVFAGVRERLRKENLTARLQAPSSLSNPIARGMPAGPMSQSSGGSLAELFQGNSNPPQPLEFWQRPFGTPASTTSPSPPSDRAHPKIPEPFSEPLSSLPGHAENPIGNGVNQEVMASQALPAPNALPPPGSFKAIQLYDTYLVLETDEGMLVIDQHALHERILFEALKKRIRSGPLETQRLLIPEPIDLSADAAAHTLEFREDLAALGLEVSDFGGGTLLLSSYPAVLGNRSPQAILQAVVDHLVGKDRPPTREVLFNDLLSLMACHAAVRAGDRLNSEEIEALVAQRTLVDDTHHCPHGRPTALLFSKHDLERQFRRV